MSYQNIYGARPPSLSGYFDSVTTTDPSKNAFVNSLQTQAEATADQSKKEAIAFAKSQLANYPPSAAVAAQYNKYAGYLTAIPGFKPGDLTDPAKAAALMQKALILYAQENGIPTNTEEAKKALASYALSIAQGYIGVPIPSGLPTNVAELKQVCIDMAATAVVMQTGVDPKLLTVTAECLLDGKLSAEDCKAIGTCAGAIAGAALAQSFGIPAPIGAFIGGKVGAMVGETFAQIFGLVDPQEAVRKMQAAFDSFAEATLAEAQAACMRVRSAYWDTFDNMLLATELQWETSELDVGWKFGIRWYGLETWSATGQPFSRAWNESAQRFIGPYTTANRAIFYSKNTNYDTYSASGELTARPTYRCSVDYGCPYPKVPDMGAGILERDAQAFLARGARWVSPDKRSTKCVFPLPAEDAAFNGEAKQRWLNGIQQTLNAEVASTQALQILCVTVIGDLVKTAAANAAEKTINDMLKMSSDDMQRAQLQRGADLSKAKRFGTEFSNFVNYGSLFVGLGVLGMVLYQKRES